MLEYLIDRFGDSTVLMMAGALTGVVFGVAGFYVPRFHSGIQMESVCRGRKGRVWVLAEWRVWQH